MFLNAISFQEPPLWLVSPFVFLLMSIAVMPVVFSHFWHKYYKLISIGLGLFVMGYYAIELENTVLPIESLAEYASFISLLTVLYVASGGIYIFADVESKPFTNIIFLFIAAVLTNIIGTTGASVLLIRPFLRLNRYRIQAYHIVFFIFMVSNLGGLLTPIGDPPLFMGFLKGVPFSWTFIHLIPEWIIANSLLLLVFYYFEKKNNKLDEVDNPNLYTNKIIINGKRNIFWLILGVLSVFLDPNIIDGLPAIEFHGRKLSFLRELIQLSSALLCFRFASKNALKSNDFDFEPIKEVAFLFFGIFLSMLPALQLLEAFAHAQKDTLQLSPGLIYWFSGFFSSVLDNAPTYINVLTLILSSAGFSINSITDVQSFLQSGNIDLLKAVSTGSVFFGAMTYIGNGPNLMVKSIAENSGIKMPSFGAYIAKYSLPILLPILLLIYLIFFAF
jgi:Na+/H+ antiporter NhaD/arsenite permease-like protein